MVRGVGPGNRCFNPRPPRGERLVQSGVTDTVRVFQPTPPARGATTSSPLAQRRSRVSTHAPRAGSDTRAHKHPHRQ